MSGKIQNGKLWSFSIFFFFNFYFRSFNFLNAFIFDKACIHDISYKAVCLALQHTDFFEDINNVNFDVLYFVCNLFKD